MKSRDVRIENIPQCLKERPQWVCWKSIPRPNAKPTKLPFNAVKGWNADSSDPNTWTTFGIALDAFKRNTSYSGIGYVFLESDPYTGIDLDDCLDDQGEFIWGKEIVDRIDTYCEVSPSGNGVKMIIEGVKPAGVTECVSKGHGPDGIGKVEVYNHSRFFALTGHRIANVPEGIMARQEQLDALCAELWPDKPKKTPEPMPAVDGEKPSKNFDEAMLNRMRTCLTEIDKMKVADKGDGSSTKRTDA